MVYSIITLCTLFITNTSFFSGMDFAPNFGNLLKALLHAYIKKVIKLSAY